MDRNNNADDGDEPPVPPRGNEGSEAKPSKQQGKANRNTSKKKKERRKTNRGKLLLDATVAPVDFFGWGRGAALMLPNKHFARMV